MIEKSAVALEKSEPVAFSVDIRNCNRTVGATLSYEITKRYGERIGLELVEAHRRVWQGPTHVCSVEVDARHARDVLLRLAFGRPLQAAELRHLCA